MGLIANKVENGSKPGLKTKIGQLRAHLQRYYRTYVYIRVTAMHHTSCFPHEILRIFRALKMNLAREQTLLCCCSALLRTKLRPMYVSARERGTRNFSHLKTASFISGVDFLPALMKYTLFFLYILQKTSKSSSSLFYHSLNVLCRCGRAIGHLTVGYFTVTGVPLFCLRF